MDCYTRAKALVRAGHNVILVTPAGWWALWRSNSGTFMAWEID